YLVKLRSILQSIGVSDCKMEEGSLRCDANISVRKKGDNSLGVKCEIKNMNSFKALEKALNYEFKRQVECIKNDKILYQETRRWDEGNSVTVVMRSKEETNDYRYLPEGDLSTVIIKDEWIEKIKRTIPELPYEKEERFIKEYNIPKYDASIITSNLYIADFFEETTKLCGDPKAASNWIMGDILKFINKNNIALDKTKITPQHLSELIRLINEGIISNSIGKKVIEEIFQTGKYAKEIVEEKEWVQNNNRDEILEVIKEVLKNNLKNVEEYKSGKAKLLGYFIGEVMKATKGKANPNIINKIIIEELNNIN
ncbi:MAG: Asp-tRNA(Asn)/Glu-tRNA(Gln) amidotransferase subunit GatB, partial [Clostridium sp.]|nr:Asp-tRNA(Asn)/Glu-tRNA(Gln) amidotransferase subunit GatB [Clostridium sp.]